MKCIQPELGAKLRKIRREKELTQKDLAKKIPTTQALISAIEKGKTISTFDTLQKIATALTVPVSALLDPIPTSENIHTFDVVPIPVFTSATAASCGAGNGLDYADWETGEILFEKKSAFTSWDDSRKPFAIHIEGDSMTDAGLTDGSIAIINPAESVLDADTALVSWKGNWFIKWIIYNPDGSIELRSANRNYQPIYIEKEYTNNEELFRIIGKVIDINSKPKRAY